MVRPATTHHDPACIDVIAGCTVKTLSFNELKERGLPDAAAETKRAVLKVPLEFPKARVKRARR